MNEIKEKARGALNELFAAYKDKGVLTTYIYGSVTTPDFVPAESDIDSIALVDTDTLVELEAEMNKFLETNFSNIERFKIRSLHIKELKTLEKIPGSLTFFLYPQSLLLDFPYWEYVAGFQFDRSEFPGVTYEDGLIALLGVLDQWDWKNVENVSKEKVGNYLKVIARMIWVLNGIKGERNQFSYSQLANEEGGYKNLAQLVLNIKKDGWSDRLFIPNKQVFQDFVDEVVAKQTK